MYVFAYIKYILYYEDWWWSYDKIYNITNTVVCTVVIKRGGPLENYDNGMHVYRGELAGDCRSQSRRKLIQEWT